jgi:serine/threonine-protein kinase
MGRPQDARSDIFSLGAVLYEMATGTGPFVAESLQGVCNRVLSSNVNPASHVQASIPTRFDEIIAGCLAKNPETRINSASLLAQMLYPLARRKVAVAAVEAPRVAAAVTLRDRASRLLRSA